jgi:hypothetical protein
MHLTFVHTSYLMYIVEPKVGCAMQKEEEKWYIHGINKLLTVEHVDHCCSIWHMISIILMNV